MYGYDQSRYYPKTSIVRVTGEQGARAYPLAPGSSVLLLDDTAPLIWLKTTDDAGYPTLVPYSITEYKPAPPIDLSSIESRLAKLESLLVKGESNESNTQST